MTRAQRVVSSGDLSRAASPRRHQAPGLKRFQRVGGAFTLVLLALVLLLAATALAAALRATDKGSSGHAATAAVPEPAGYWTGDINSPTPATLHGGKVIDAQHLSTLLRAGNLVVVDVSNAARRPESLAPGAPWLPLPHLGIPGALWIPGAGLGAVPVSIDSFFRAQLAAATAGDFSRPIVIYCHERCWLSWNAAKRAIDFGYRNVSWFPAGIEGWRAQGFSTEELKPAEPPPASPGARPPAADSSSGAAELA